MLANVRRVFSHLAVYGSGEILLFGISFLLVPVYTRVLTPAEYGVLGLLLLLRAFLRPLNQLGLDESFLRFYYDCGDDAARRTLTGTTLVAIGLASGVVLSVLLAGAPTFSRLLLGSAEHAWTLRLLALNGFLQAFLCVPTACSGSAISRRGSRAGRWAAASAPRRDACCWWSASAWACSASCWPTCSPRSSWSPACPAWSSAPSDAPRGSGLGRCCVSACRWSPPRCCNRSP